MPRRLVSSERGSAPVEFVLVGVLLTVLTLSVMQLALALHVRNTLHDAAAEGARYAALAGNTLDDGRQRTIDIVGTAVGSGYAQDVSAQDSTYLGAPAVAVTIRTPMPLIGMVGIPSGLEVTAHAAVERTE